MVANEVFEVEVLWKLVTVKYNYKKCDLSTSNWNFVFFNFRRIDKRPILLASLVSFFLIR